MTVFVAVSWFWHATYMTSSLSRIPHDDLNHGALPVAVRVMLCTGSTSSAGLEAEIGDCAMAAKVSLAWHGERWDCSTPRIVGNSAFLAHICPLQAEGE